MCHPLYMKVSLKDFLSTCFALTILMCMPPLYPLLHMFMVYPYAHLHVAGPPLLNIFLYSNPPQTYSPYLTICPYPISSCTMTNLQ